MKIDTRQPSVGDVIKSFDFPTVKNCYFVGIVTQVDLSGLIHCKTVKQVWQDRIMELNDGNNIFRTPMQGYGMLDDKYQRIEILA
jgi:hypothetical protein